MPENLGLRAAGVGDVDVMRGRDSCVPEGARGNVAERIVVGAPEALRAPALEASRIALVLAAVLAGLRSRADARGTRRGQVLAAGMADDVRPDAEAGEHYDDRERHDHRPQADPGDD